jgi:peptidoglycan/xylan/chitin deacetylase (PgdA/CDA1 family)
MIAIGLVTAFFLLLFLFWRARYRYPPHDVPQVLCYHKLSQRFCFEVTWMTPGRFMRQIDHLVNQGYEFIGESEFADAVLSPTAENAKKILLTFDDGYEELYGLYRNYIETRGIPLLVFLVTGYVGGENRWDLSIGRRAFSHLSWKQIVELADCGVSFGSHGISHRDLRHLDPGELENETAGSKSAIEERIQREVRSFSYPFGRYNERVRSTVNDAGYKLGFSLYPPRSNEDVDLLALRRNGVYIIDTPFTIECKLTRNPLFWFEEMKCRAINQVAVLTPIFKRFSAGLGK